MVGTKHGRGGALMAAWWSGSVTEFLAADIADLLGRLAHEQAQQFRNNEPAALRSWQTQIAVLGSALALQPDLSQWRILLEYSLIRLGKRIDAVILTDRLILVIVIRYGA